MRTSRFALVVALGAVSLPFVPPSATRADDTDPVTREEHDRVLEELADLRRLIDSLTSGEAPPESDTSAKRLPGGKGGLYDKPFLEELRTRVYLGGYFDVEYRNEQNQIHEFRFHRLIPFIYADIHERIRFATEIEFEDGEEVAVEFSYLDILFTDEINFRGGVILSPLGKFNLIHDSPVNDLTDRPLVNRFVIPTTMREVGVGLFGTLTEQESEWEVKYEAYLTSGFKGLDDAGNVEITPASGVRGARPHSDGLGTRNFDDINNQFAGNARVSVSPFIGSEVGASVHSGAYDEDGDNNLTIGAIDALFTLPEQKIGDVPIGPIEFQGEAAHAWIERDSLARASGVADNIWGYYVQTNYHFMPSCLTENLPLVFFPGSTFTLVGRWGQIDLDGNKQRRFTIGLNYRPVESTVLKFDYQFNQGTGSAPDSADDDAFVASIASYF